MSAYNKVITQVTTNFIFHVTYDTPYDNLLQCDIERTRKLHNVKIDVYCIFILLSHYEMSYGSMYKCYSFTHNPQQVNMYYIKVV